MSDDMKTKMKTPEAVEITLREQHRLMLVCATMVTDLDSTQQNDQKALDELREDLKLHQALGVMLNNTTKLLTMQNNPFNQADGEPQT